MPLPVINNVYRVTLDWDRAAGIAPRNVMHVLDFDGLRNEAAVGDDVGTLLGTIGHQFDCVSDVYTCSHLTVIKLDGTSASQVVAFSETSGQASGDVIPASSGVLSLRTNTRGPRGRGRLYLGPTGEGVQDNGSLGATTVTAMQSAWTTFIDDLAGLAHPLPMVVASYKHATSDYVVSVSMDTLCGTQRRRQDQLR